MVSKYSILICGAGPTGLMLAAQLLRYKADFIIIDKKQKPTTESRALVVQAKSMEIYEQMSLSDEIIRTSVKADGICFWRKGSNVGKVTLKDLGPGITPFDSIVIYEQNKNETLLYHYLQQHKHEVIWNTELVSYKDNGNGYTVTVKQNDVSSEISTTFLVACDGAGSRVRKLSAMQFEGGTYEHVFYVADTHVSAPVCHHKLNFFVAADTFHLLFPMEGEKRYRAIGILPKKYYNKSDINFDEMSAEIDKDAHIQLGFFDTQWYSTYKLHHKKVQSFKKDNIFFCGDAGHVHSPAGGQGMNTGLQDAYNLAWKLGLVVEGKAKYEILKTYHEERNPVAKKLLQTTDRMFNIMSKNNLLHRIIRMYLAPFILPSLMRISKVRRSFFMLLSQTEINYKQSRLSCGKEGNIQAGMRFPYFNILVGNEITSVFHFIREKGTSNFLALLYELSPNGTVYPDIHFAEIEKNSYNDNALKKAGFPKSFICLVRPDNYIGYIAVQYSKTDLSNYLDTFIQGRNSSI